MTRYALSTWAWWCRLFHRNWWLLEIRYGHTDWPGSREWGWTVRYCSLCGRDRR